MKALKQICIAILLIAPVFLNAQTKLVTKFSTNYKLEKRTLIEDMFSIDKNGFYVIKINYDYDGELPIVEYYNTNLVLEKSIKIDLHGAKFKEYTIQNNKVFIITSELNEETQIEKFYAQQLRLDDLTLSTDKKLLYEMNFEKFAYDRKLAQFKVTKFSEDSSKIMICFEYYEGYFKNDKQNFFVYVFDNEFNEIWNRRISLPLPITEIVFKDVYVDNIGTAHMLCGYKPQEDNSVLKDVIYTLSKEKIDKFEFALYNRSLIKTVLQVSDSKKYLVAGIYKEYNETGIFTASINKTTKTIADTSFRKVNDPILATHNCVFHDFIPVQDSGYFLVGEFNHRSLIPYSARTDRTNVLDIRKEDLIAFYVTMDKGVVFTRAIPKTQMTSYKWELKHFGYAHFLQNKELFFLYNDVEGNLTCRTKECLKEYEGTTSKSELVLANISHDRKTEKLSVSTQSTTEFVSIPNTVLKLSDTEFVVWGISKKYYKLLKVSMK